VLRAARWVVGSEHRSQRGTPEESTASTGGQFTVVRHARSKRTRSFRVPPAVFPSSVCLCARVGLLLLLLLDC
jgi:hypothetical protein